MSLEIRAEFPPPDPARWRELAERDLGGAAWDKRLVSSTLEGLAIQPLYTEADLPGGPAPAGVAGQAPFTRHARPAAERPGWVGLSEETHHDPAELGPLLAEELSGGAQGVLLRLDEAARRGEALDLVGAGGVALRDLGDVRAALGGLDPAVPVWLEAGASALPAAALRLAASEEAGLPPARLQGNLGADPLGTLAALGRLPRPAEEALAELGALGRWCAEAAPGLRAVRLATSPWHDAGASDAEELGLGLADALEALRALTAAGLDGARACDQVALCLALDDDLFLQVAKLRAARRLWARVSEVVAGAPRALRVEARTSFRMLSTRDPWVNALRSTVAAAAGAIGGAEAITVLPFDAPLGPPDARSRRLARNTQLILREEGHLDRVVDPGGGSYLVESLTESLAAAAWGVLQEVEREGGLLQALRRGWVTARLDATAERRAAEVARRKRPLTGVSEFPLLDEPPPARPAPDLTGWRGRRETARRPLARPGAPRELLALARAARDGADLFALAPPSAGPPERLASALPVRRSAAPWEALRAESDRELARSGRRPAAFLAAVGPRAEHDARSTWVQNLLAAGGIACAGEGAYPDGDAAARAFAASRCAAAVISAADKRYPELVPGLARALRAAGARRVLLAGRAGEQEAAWREAGVDGFVAVGSDVLGTLSGLLTLAKEER